MSEHSLRHAHIAEWPSSESQGEPWGGKHFFFFLRQRQSSPRAFPAGQVDLGRIWDELPAPWLGAYWQDSVLTFSICTAREELPGVRAAFLQQCCNNRDTSRTVPVKQTALSLLPTAIKPRCSRAVPVYLIGLCWRLTVHLTAEHFSAKPVRNVPGCFSHC